MVPFYCSAMQIDEKFNVYMVCGSMFHTKLDKVDCCCCCFDAFSHNTTQVENTCRNDELSIDFVQTEPYTIAVCRTYVRSPSD